MILAADIGGTKCHLALADLQGRLKCDRRYPSADFDGIEPLLRTFLDHCGQTAEGVEILVLALPAPIEGECIGLTNLPWKPCRSALQEQFPHSRIELVNDFQAAALGAVTLGPDRLMTLNDRPADPKGRKLALGAGTGMGVAYLQPAHGGHHPWPTEAGHLSFAPEEALEWRLAEYLRERHGRASWERVLSGPGLADLYRFLAPEAPPLAPPAVIDAANANRDEQAVAALRLFVRLYGRFCGDLALAWLPRGGLYLLGGVTLHITGWLQQPAFLAAYGAKGRMSELVNRFPIHIVLEPRAGLLGAIQFAIQTQVRP